jgi:hypothetical protein
MTAGLQCPDGTHKDHDDQRSGEQVGRDHEDHAGVMDAAHVHDGEDEQDGEA